MSRFNFKSTMKMLAFALMFWSIGYAQAYDRTVANNLGKTRDALLDQRSHLAAKADEIKGKMAELDKQLGIVESYIRDTDSAIRDIEDAIRRAS